jgi:hypothetical protein
MSLPLIEKAYDLYKTKKKRPWAFKKAADSAKLLSPAQSAQLFKLAKGMRKSANPELYPEQMRLLTVGRSGMKLREFRYYPYPGNPYDKDFAQEREKERRHGLIKAGLVGAGLLGGGALVGRGLFRAGVSAAARRADDLAREVDFLKTAKKAEKLDEVAPAAKSRKPIKVAATPPPAPKTTLPPPPPPAPPAAVDKSIQAEGRKRAPVQTKAIEQLKDSGQISQSDATAEIQEIVAGAKPTRKLTPRQQVLAKRQAKVAKFASAQSSAAPAPAVPKAPAPPKAKPKAAPAPVPAARASDEFWEKEGLGKVPLTGTPEQNAALRKKLEETYAAGGFKGRVKGDVIDDVRASLAKAGESAGKSDFPPGLSEALRQEAKKSNPPKAAKKSKKSKAEDDDLDDPGASPEEAEWEEALNKNQKPEPKSKSKASKAPAKGEKLSYAEKIAARVKAKRQKKKNLADRLRGIRYFNFQTDEGGIPFTGKVAKDRFIKQIRDQDLRRRDSNLLRAGAAGALAGVLFRGRLSMGRRALIGAGLGAGGVIGTRAITDRTRDVYGERSHEAMRAEALPAIAGLGTAGWLATRRIRGLAAKFRGVKEFSILNKISNLTGMAQIKAGREALEKAKSNRQLRDIYRADAIKQNKFPYRDSDLQYEIESGMRHRAIARGTYAKYDVRRARNLINEGIRRRNISIGVGAGVAGLGAGAGYLATRKESNLAAKLRGLKEFEDYKLYYFKGRNTGIAARSADEARKKKKRGGDELVAVRTPNKTERSQMARGIWVRTRRDGKSPGQSRYGKGRGQGPARKKEMSAKFFEKRDKEKGGLNPYVGAALSGFGSGAALGSLALLRRGATFRSAAKTAGKLGLASAGIVGGGALLGSKIIGNPRDDESAPFTKRAAIGGALVGSGAGLAGALLLRRTKGGARALVGASKKTEPFSRPAMWLRKTPLAGAAGIGALGGALYGGAMGADEGQQVDSIRNLRKDLKKEMSARLLRARLRLFGRGDQARWDAQGTNEDARFANTAWGWAVDRPMYIPRRDKQGRVVKDPITGEAMRQRWEANTPQLWNSVAREAGRQRVNVQRGGRLSRDVFDEMRGAPRQRDASGRIKKREWEKSWFQNKATEIGLTVAGLGGLGAIRYANNNPDTKAGRAWRNTQSSLRTTKDNLAEIGSAIMRGATSITARRRFSAKLRKLRELDAFAEYQGWDVRDPRGRSARVFAPGSRRRERRPKEWHEKTENERKLWKAGLVASALGGAGAMLVGQRLVSGKSLVPSRFLPKKPVIDPEKVVTGVNFKKGAA